MKRRKAPCPLTVWQRARFIDALGAGDVSSLEAELRLLEARCAAWRAFTGRREDLAAEVAAGAPSLEYPPQINGSDRSRELLRAMKRELQELRKRLD